MHCTVPGANMVEQMRRSARETDRRAQERDTGGHHHAPAAPTSSSDHDIKYDEDAPSAKPPEVTPTK